MKNKEFLQHSIDSLKEAGAHKVECVMRDTEKKELNVDFGEFSLFRTTYDTSLTLTAIKDDKEGTVSINKLDKDSVDHALVEVLQMAESAEPDEAHDIAPKQPAKEFKAGIEEPDLDLMYDRTKKFLDHVKKTYPTTNLRGIIFDFTRTKRYYLNSNGTDFVTTKGLYTFVVLFSSREGKSISSFNYSAYNLKDLEQNLIDIGSVDTLLRESTEQVKTQTLPEKFVGDVIVTPDCMYDFVEAVTGFLGDFPLITGTSIYKDKLGETIASDKLTLHSMPTSDEIADPYFFTGDGFEAQNSTIIDKGVLKTFLLSLYGSKKTGLEKAVNRGGCYVIDPGDIAFEEMIKSTKKGILLSRFSGGRPSRNGDFSGVAKNSYYIEDGEIKYPLIETMVSSNIKDMMMKVKNISKERINFGYSVYPWIQFTDITVSGK